MNGTQNSELKTQISIKACIFDLDGVIVDTAVYHYKAWKRLANEIGLDFTEEENEKLKGISRIRSLELILSWGGITRSAIEMEELAARKNIWYVEMISKMQSEEILPGALELLKELRSSGIKTALGSASKNSQLILQKTGLLDFFDAIVDGNTVSASKPDPEVFLKGAEMLGVDPADCLVFEDAVAGVQAAHAAGMKVIGIGSEKILNGADLIISGLHEITLQDLYSVK